MPWLAPQYEVKAVSALLPSDKTKPSIEGFYLTTAVPARGNAVFPRLLLLRRKLITEDRFSRRTSRQKNQSENSTNKLLHVKSPVFINSDTALR